MSPSFKGFLGELKLRILFFIFLSFSYKIFHNVTIKLPNNKTSQIDHILVSKKGIFVIETKNYSGVICSNNNAGTWTQSFGKKSFEFYSPVWQNNGHISALNYLLYNPGYPIHNIVCFIGTARFKDSYTPREVYLGGLSAIEGILKHKENILTSEEKREVIRLIKKRRMPRSWFTNRKHVKNIQNRR